MFPVVNVISFSPLDQQLLRFSPLLDHVTGRCAIYSNQCSLILRKEISDLVLGLNYCHPLLWLLNHQPVLLKLIDLDHQMFCKML